MREHPIPQDITNYKFHLVGNMTLKQFAEIMAGAVLALLSYKSGLPGFIKWPLLITFALLGFGAAFVPIEGRPLDQWLINFVKVLYKPTKFFWKREPKIPDAFNYQAKDNQDRAEPELDYGPIRKEKIQEFLRSMNNPTQELDDFDQQQQQQISQILQTFSQTSMQSPAQTSSQSSKKQAEKPSLKVRVRKMKDLSQKNNQELQQRQKLVAQKQQKDQARETDQNESEDQDEKWVEEPQQAQPASQNQDLPFPIQPEQPNKIVGMVLSQDNELIDNALVEIKDEQKQTITAVKSNGLGQFSISQPLSNGQYQVIISKQGYDFDYFRLELSGDIVKPLEIRAKN